MKARSVVIAAAAAMLLVGCFSVAVAQSGLAGGVDPVESSAATDAESETGISTTFDDDYGTDDDVERALRFLKPRETDQETRPWVRKKKIYLFFEDTVSMIVIIR